MLVDRPRDLDEQIGGALVVELVKLDEVASLDVPVRLLHLRVEIERVGQTCVQEIDELVARRVGDVDASRKGAAGLRRHEDLPGLVGPYSHLRPGWAKASRVLAAAS